MAFNTVLAVCASSETEISNLFVVLMGFGVVFVGLLSIVFLSVVMSAVIRAFEGKKVDAPAAAPMAAPAVVAAPITNRGELVAAISACVAEELGTEVSAIRIVSIKAM